MTRSKLGRVAAVAARYQWSVKKVYVLGGFIAGLAALNWWSRAIDHKLGVCESGWRPAEHYPTQQRLNDGTTSPLASRQLPLQSLSEDDWGLWEVELAW